MKKGGNIFKVHNADAREIAGYIDDAVVDVAITSPPYFNLKDYGNKNQIGFGQGYETYLEDIKKVFEGVYKVLKNTGSLWVVIDTFKKDSQLFPLPFDFADQLKTVGWKLQDIIIWSKERTLPWSHHGQTRSMFEYVLVFKKAKKFRYYTDRVRDFETLKKWWVKYPERYNPRGKAPDEIWRYDIPTQGSWGNGYVRHFCPLPEELVQRIILLTTDRGDVVLDPFSGSGTVPAQASFMGRQYIGFELNKSYIKLFQKYLKNNLTTKRDQYERNQKFRTKRTTFEKLILNLRTLKFAAGIKKNLTQTDKSLIIHIYAEIINLHPEKKHHLIKANYKILIKDNANIKLVEKRLFDIVNKPPLSKYGIEPQLELFTNSNLFIKQIGLKKLFGYETNRTYNFSESVKRTSLKYPIISPIKISLNERDYE
jgi:DNA modification methylase